MPSDHTTSPSDWLAQVREDVVEAELVIVDPHHHLWDYPESRGFQPTYLLRELRADAGDGHNVVETVFVECDWAYRTDGPEHLRCVGETEVVATVARESATSSGTRIAAIVGSCDLTLDPGSLSEVLDAHVEAGGGRFRGIRQRLANDPTGSAHTSRAQAPSPDLSGDPSFRRGLRELGRRNLSFEAWAYHPQLANVADMARSTPDTTIVLNHIGAPLGIGAYAGRREEIHAEWRESMSVIAELANVVVKLGGIGMPTYGSGWKGRATPATSDEIVAQWGDPLRFLIDTFGPRRCMFESNFPVDKVSFSYRTLWNAFKKLTADRSSDDRSDLFSGTARRVYRLPSSDEPSR